MQTLFGLPMGGLAVGLAAALALLALGVLVLAWRHPILVKIGVRNIPRRRTQSVLIVFGLMLSATIIAASLGVGDTVNYSIRRSGIETLGHSDEWVRSRESRLFASDYFPVDRAREIESALRDNPLVDGVLPQIREVSPVINPAAIRTIPRTAIAAIDPDRTAGFGNTRTSDGKAVSISDLGRGEVLLNEDAQEELDAGPGARLILVTPTGRHEISVRAVVRNGNLAGSSPRVLMSLADGQGMFARTDQVNRIDISNAGDAFAGNQHSEEVTSTLRLLLADPVAAERLHSVLGTPRNRAMVRAAAESEPPGRLQSRFLRLAETLEAPRPSDEFKSLLSDTEIAGLVGLALERDGRAAEAVEFSALAAQLRLLSVDDIKSNALQDAERVSDGVTRLFLVFGSFSIIVGMLLIFLIFVLLAAARRTEMGITRAVGARRRQLVQVFVFEGVVYAVGAAALGTVIGLLASQLLVSFIPQSDQIGFRVVRHFEPRSAAVAFCLGLVLTLATVAVSAYRVSRVNVVSAIRGLEDETSHASAPAFGGRFSRLVAAAGEPAVRIFRRSAPRPTPSGGEPTPVRKGRPLRWAGTVVSAFWGVIYPFFRQGWPLIILGAYMTVQGTASAQAFGVRAGVSLTIIGAGLTLRWVLERLNVGYPKRGRIAFTAAGLLLILFWSMPFQWLFEIFGELEGGTEMFVLAGVTMVSAAVWVVMYNTSLFVWAANRTLGRIGRMTPVLRTAIAYPMAARFRTGLTLAMFALIIFTLMVIAILTNTSQIAFERPHRVTGGYEITASVPVDLAVPDINAALSGVPGVSGDDFLAIAGSTYIPARAREPAAKVQLWQPISVRAVDEVFLETNRLELAHYDPSYGRTPREIWDALRSDPDLAVLSSSALPARFEQQIEIHGTRYQSSQLLREAPEVMSAFVVELRDPAGARPPMTRTVIAVTDQLADLLGDFPTLTTGTEILGPLSAKPIPITNYHFRLRQGLNPVDVADRLETGLVEHGIEANVNERELRELLSVNNSLNQLFQSFMGLGLVVGVAALGVLSFRAVVERRQAIGMMKAIGFKPGMIALGFLMESSVVSLLGILLGIGLGSLISWNIVNELKNQIEGLRFTVPWGNVAAIVSIAWGFSIIATLWPAWQASRIYAAEALRYE
ncbi:MAG: FtsX-like permease family protein [Chloroflexi bacterium]|nr:FtsX-like permease family protein [Chloroflexota bacterium]